MLRTDKIGRMRIRRKATAPVIAAILLFGMIFTVGFSYFYITTTDQIKGDEALQQQAHLQSQQSTNQANLLVYGAAISNTLEFYVNNTGPAESLIAYWILNGTSAKQLLYENSTYICWSPNATNSNSSCNHITTNPLFPLSLAQGQSTNPPIDTKIPVTSITQSFVIRVLTASGIISLGAYPSEYTSSSSLTSDVTAGIGSALVSFSSFYWYDYVSGPAQQDADADYNNLCAQAVQCNGGSWVFDASHPHSGPLVPEGQNHTNNGCTYCGIEVPLVFSVNVTNQDPQQADLVVNSLANLWIVETCDAGTPTSHCGETSPVYVFYVVNVNPSTGAITSTTAGSFTQINIPYGVTKTLYFASAYPVASNNFQYMSLGTDDSTIPGNNLAYYGQFALFLLLPGTKIAGTQILIYGQNIPFESTIAGDNLGWYTETPSSTTGGMTQPFQLTVNDSYFAGNPIDQIVVNASAFSGVTAVAPTGWSESVSSGIITWTNTNSNYLINPGQTLNFYWAGVAPAVNVAVQEIFPLAIYWSAGALTELQGATACFVNPGSLYPPPKVQPTGIVDYVPITVTNLQPSQVSGGTPIMLNVDWGTYSSYLDNPVNNVLFFDWSGNSLNAWIENGTASSTANSIVWVDLNSTGIKPLTSITIYMGFYALAGNHLSASGPLGEAPQLSSTYAQYDDGSIVFSAYVNGNTALSNFNLGTSITLAKSTGVAYGTGTVNALHLTGTGTDITMVYNAVSLPNEPLVAESNFESGAVPTSQGAVSLDDNANPGSSANAIGVDFGYSSSYFSNAYESGSAYTFDQNQQGTGSSTWLFSSVTYSGSSATSWSGYISSELYVGGYSGTISNNPLGSVSSIHLSVLSSANSNYPDNMYYNWMRVRVAPPNGVMPYSSFGPVFA